MHEDPSARTEAIVDDEPERPANAAADDVSRGRARIEDVAQEPRSYTGGYLKDLLAKSVRAEVTPAPARKKRGSASVREREAAE